MTTQTPPGETVTGTPTPGQTGSRPAVPTSWEPGDPLHAPSSYRQGLFSFRDDDGESWVDAAVWNADGSASGIERHLGRGDLDELRDFIEDWHRWDRAGRPDPEPPPTLPPTVLLALSTTVRAVRAAMDDQAAADRLRAMLTEATTVDEATLDRLRAALDEPIRGGGPFGTGGR